LTTTTTTSSTPEASTSTAGVSEISDITTWPPFPVAALARHLVGMTELLDDWYQATAGRLLAGTWGHEAIAYVDLLSDLESILDSLDKVRR
jgi:hypothetical protein